MCARVRYGSNIRIKHLGLRIELGASSGAVSLDQLALYRAGPPKHALFEQERKREGEGAGDGEGEGEGEGGSVTLVLHLFLSPSPSFSLTHTQTHT